LAARCCCNFAIALVVTQVPFVWTLVGYANKAVFAIEAGDAGRVVLHVRLSGGAPIAVRPEAEGASPPVIIAFQILPLIIVFPRSRRCCGTGAC
jgi:concentrative nucleoside transporter, CNT family